MAFISHHVEFACDTNHESFSHNAPLDIILQPILHSALPFHRQGIQQFHQQVSYNLQYNDAFMALSCIMACHLTLFYYESTAFTVNPTMYPTISPTNSPTIFPTSSEVSNDETSLLPIIVIM